MEPTKIFIFEIYFGLYTHHQSFNSENKKENKTTISNIVMMTFVHIQDSLLQQTRAMIKRSSVTDHNLITSSLLLYSSLVLMDGLRSRICSASRVSRKLSPRDVEWRMSTWSLVSVTLHCARCVFIGPALWRCSLRRVWICRPVWPT